MRRLATFGGVVVLMLTLAAPASANQKEVQVPGFSGPFDFWELVDIEDPLTDWPFECDGPIYYGSYGEASLTLWYAKGETDLFPEDGAWPWLRGRYERQGVDYFSSLPDGQGIIVSGTFKISTHLADHHLGDPSIPGDFETWTEKLTGRNWGIHLPGLGPLFRESGNYMYEMSVVDQTPGAEVIVSEEVYPWRGHQTFDTEALCAFFGFDVVLAP